jgi:parallel beta-helix repeat protein
MFLSLLLAACQKPAEEPPVPDGVTCADLPRANCVEIEAGDSQTLQDTVNTLENDTAIVLAEGTYVLDNAVTLRGDSLTLIGQGKDLTVLDFASVAAQTNGIDVVGDDFHVEGLTVVDAKKDGIRIEDADGVVIRGVKVTWSAGAVSTNGAYGIYPVRVSNVLLEDSEAYNASDAGIYVGQCQHAVVRNNIAKQNVAGIEIENTQFADVYGNLAEDNTGGLVVFDLPGNPVIGRDIRIHDNVIISNNRPNFAPGGTVRQIPAGTGTFALASRRLEIDHNRYEGNDSGDIAILSGLVIEGDPSLWFLPEDQLVGDTSGLEADLPGDGGMQNFRTYDIFIHDNTHTGSGTNPDMSSLEDRQLGFLLGVLYAGEPVDNVLYDAVGESSFDATDASLNSNDNRICVAPTEGSMASLDLENLAEQSLPSIDTVYRPAPPFAPFDCVGVTPLPPEVDAP